MKIKLQTLKLICRKSEELVDLRADVTFFHGQLSAGKSSIARLIDYCLGGSLEATTAIQQEMVAAQLSLTIADNDVLIERNKGENKLQVTWSGPATPPNSVLVDARGDGPAVVSQEIRNLSDLLFHLLGLPVIKVRTRTDDPDSPLARLSFRDIMKFCYLPQEDLDSSFFLLMTPIRKEKSKDVLNYVLGFFSDRLNELQIQYDRVATEQRTKELSAKRIREFLAQFEFGTNSDIDAELAAISNELTAIDAQLADSANAFRADTHFADDRRNALRELTASLAEEEEALLDVSRKIEEQEELKAELISMKFKTARADSARNVLAGAKFRVCPNCGEPLSKHRVVNPEDCYLCLQPPSTIEPDMSVDIVRADLDARIAEVDGYLKRQSDARVALEKQIAATRERKRRSDRELSRLLADYETDMISRTREAERARAALLERQSLLEKLRQLPEAVSTMADEADALRSVMEKIARQIDEEKRRLSAADENFELLEQFYLEALVAIGLPGISADDVIKINRRTLIPEIFPLGDQTISYTFFNAGSGGKKVLLAICFALALHRVAAVRDLPLPSLLMIDSPMKNITPDINRQIFNDFYKYLYGLVATDLAEVQILVIDQTLVEPEEDLQISFHERLLQRGDPENPPLISYYDGP